MFCILPTWGQEGRKNSPQGSIRRQAVTEQLLAPAVGDQNTANGGVLDFIFFFTLSCPLAYFLLLSPQMVCGESRA